MEEKDTQDQFTNSTAIETIDLKPRIKMTEGHKEHSIIDTSSKNATFKQDIVRDEEENSPDSDVSPLISNTYKSVKISEELDLNEKNYYGLLFPIITWGNFPIFVVHKEWLKPIGSLAFCIFLRFFLGQYYEFFYGKYSWIAIMINNILIINVTVLTFSNPGIAGYKLGSSIRHEKADE